MSTITGAITGVHDYGWKRVLDFIAAAAGFTAQIEVKYGIPSRKKGMERLISQVRAMSNHPKTRRVVFLFKDDPDGSAKRRLERVLEKENAGPAEIFSGGQEIAGFLREFLMRGI